MNEQRIAHFKRFIEERIAPDLNSGCWLWTGVLHSVTGYGTIGVRKLGKLRHYGAHRASWMVRHGEIPAGMVICHKCDVRACVNPDHLFLGTQKDNLRDMYAKGRLYNRGSSNGSAKLSDEQVLAIRRDTRTCDEVSAEYGIGRSTVSRVRQRKVYWNIPDELMAAQRPSVDRV